MSPAAHTPGPWVIEDGWLQNERGPYVDGQYLSVCVSATRLPDGQLIAAAPELLEAAEWAADNYENININHVDYRVEVKRRMDAAIAKAKGLAA